MVEAAKTQNPFATDKSNCCSYMGRYGVCLEPEMCFLIHDTQAGSTAAVAQAPSQMSTAAKEFNPFAASSGTSAATFKEFVPP